MNGSLSRMKVLYRSACLSPKQLRLPCKSSVPSSRRRTPAQDKGRFNFNQLHFYHQNHRWGRIKTLCVGSCPAWNVCSFPKTQALRVGEQPCLLLSPVRRFLPTDALLSSAAKTYALHSPHLRNYLLKSHVTNKKHCEGLHTRHPHKK